MVEVSLSSKGGCIMGVIKIVANACCDLTPEEAKEMDVTLVPECIVLGGKEYLSVVDFSSEELYKMMAAEKNAPTGSQPNIGMYMSAFESLKGKCDDIICINMTSRMSGSYNTAMIAKSMLEDENFPARIHIFDSLELTHGMAFLIRKAYGLAEEGKSAEEILEQLEKDKSRIGIYFVMKSLESARKAGRLGAIKAVMADAMNLKPVLMFRDGIVSDVGIARSFNQALGRLMPYYEKQGQFGKEVTVFHADNRNGALKVKERIEAIDPEAKVSIAWLGSGIGIYTGAGAVGIVFWEKPRD